MEKILKLSGIIDSNNIAELENKILKDIEGI